MKLLRYIIAACWFALAYLAHAADLGTGSPPCIAPVTPKVVQPSKILGVLPAGWHSHRCNRCGTTWSHGHESYGRAADHACPKCGLIQWHKSPVTIRPARLCPD